jgi:hypothetical protein
MLYVWINVIEQREVFNTKKREYQMKIVNMLRLKKKKKKKKRKKKERSSLHLRFFTWTASWGFESLLLLPFLC